MGGVPKTPSLGMTITTLNLRLQKALEPYASEPQERVNTLKKAKEKGIKTWVFLGPLIPEFTDTPANLEAIFRALKGLDEDYSKFRLLFYLRAKAQESACQAGLSDKVKFCF